MKQSKIPNDHREFLKLMIGDCYTMPRMSNTGEPVYMVYHGNQVPVKYFTKGVGETYKHLYKKDKKNRLTLNIAKVRQLDGRSFTKKMYKVVKKVGGCKMTVDSKTI